MSRSAIIVAFVGLSVWLLHSQTDAHRGADLFRERRFREAAAALERHLSTKPDDLQLRLLLGLSYQLAEDLPRAESVFREAVRRAPAHAVAHYSLARVLYLRGKLTEAEAEAAAARKNGEALARVHTLLGLIRIEQRRFEDAVEEFKSAMRFAQGTFVEPFLQAATLFLKLNRNEDALRALDEVRKRAGDSPEVAKLRERASRTRTVVPAAQSASIALEDITQGTGIQFVLNNSPTRQKHLIETMPGGLAVFDYDGDGLPDIYFTNGAALPPMDKSAPRHWNRLYRNLGGLRFRDVTTEAGVAGRGYSMGAAVADYDGDGDVDLFVAGVKSNVLYRNRGDGTFEDVTSAAGVASTEWSVAGAWLDYDRDGRLDLFVVNYLNWEIGKEPYCGDEAKAFRVYCHPRYFAGTSNRLYRNLGGGRFEDASHGSGIARSVGKGMSAAVADADGDGFTDIFVTNDAVPNFFFRNKGDGTFEETAVAAGVALTDDGKAVSGMGTDFRDFDNDGLPDIVLTALAGETFPLFRNTGKGRFQDATYTARLGIASAKWSGWGVGLIDLNNDGWKDIVSANSHVTDNIETFSHDEYRQQNTVFRNAGGVFEVAVPFGSRRAHRGLAFGDLDSDGRMDVVVTALGERAEIWRNVTPGDANWLQVVAPIGATVRVGRQVNVMTSSTGYAASSHGPVHFGLGREKVVDVEVRWPSGCSQIVKAVAANQRLHVKESCGAESPAPPNN